MKYDIRKQFVVLFLESMEKAVTSYIEDGEYSHPVKVHLDMAMCYAGVLGYQESVVTVNFDFKLAEKLRQIKDTAPEMVGVT